ncbi:MAG: phosphatidylglycerophosphatase A [Candidatus Theseobacter exili]|nr:phosphatidylglycerophosphatase A [Candidatus Theseobacter exili]
MSRPVIILFSSFFGLGFLPFAPGTFGALGGVVLLLIINWIGLGTPGVILAGVFLFFAGVYISDKAEMISGIKDDSRIVIDEAMSIPISFVGITLSGPIILTGFLLNRFFDIYKPFPINRSQKLNGGWGIMTDDLIAGVYTNIMLRVLMIMFSMFNST